MTNIKTDCSQCTRLVETLDDDGKDEKWCSLGLFEKYKAAGDTITDIPTVSRICPYFTKETPPGDEQAVRDAMTLRYLAVIWFDPAKMTDSSTEEADIDGNCDAIDITIACLRQVKPYPAAVEVVMPAGWPDWAKEATERCKNALPDTVWNIRAVSTKEKDAAVDEAIKGRNSAELPYYLVLEAGAEPRADLAARLDKLLNDDMQRIVCLTPSKEAGAGVGPMVHTMIHQALGGNAKAFHDIHDSESGEVVQSVKCHTIVDKISMMAFVQNRLDLIRPLDSLWATKN